MQGVKNSFLFIHTDVLGSCGSDMQGLGLSWSPWLWMLAYAFLKRSYTVYSEGERGVIQTQVPFHYTEDPQVELSTR